MAIAYDNSTSSSLTATGNTSVTYAHTVSGSDRFLLISGSTLNWTADNPSSVSATYNGVSATVLHQNIQSYNTNNWRTHLLRLIAPDTGSNNVVFSTSGGSGRVGSSAFSYTGVDQTSPILTSNTVSAPTDGSGATATISLTTTGAGWWFISGTNVDADWTAGGGNTGTLRKASSTTGGGADSNGSVSAQTGNASITRSTGTRGYGAIAVAFKAVGNVDVTASPAVLAMTFSLPASTVTAVRVASVSPSPLTATFSLPASSVSGGASVSPSVLSATFSIPLASADGESPNAEANPAVITATFSIISPTVDATQNPEALPPALVATFSIPAPSVTATEGITVTPTELSGTFSIVSPTVSVVSNMVVYPEVIVATLSIALPRALGDFWQDKFATLSDPFTDTVYNAGDNWQDKF